MEASAFLRQSDEEVEVHGEPDDGYLGRANKIRSVLTSAKILTCEKYFGHASQGAWKIFHRMGAIIADPAAVDVPITSQTSISVTSRPKEA